MQTFPLDWPIGYKRSKKRFQSQFKQTMDKSQQFLHSEIKRLEATGLIVSTNIPVRKDGMLYADWMNKKIEDPGVAIYFKYKGKNIAMCCDQYERVWENIYALAKSIEAIRGMERWGVSEFLDRTFNGFTALPEVINIILNWRDVLSIHGFPSRDELKAAYLSKAKSCHPDAGGTHNDFIQVQNAYKSAKAELRYE